MIRQTSIDIYHQIQNDGLLSKRRWQVYDILYQHGPLTGGEVASYMKSIHGVRGFSESVRNRLTELREMGAAREVGETSCPVTGNQVILWDVTGDLPRQIDKSVSPTKTELIRSLCDKLETMCAHLDEQSNVPKQWREWSDRSKAIILQCSKHRKNVTKQ